MYLEVYRRSQFPSKILLVGGLLRQRDHAPLPAINPSAMLFFSAPYVPSRNTVLLIISRRPHAGPAAAVGFIRLGLRGAGVASGRCWAGPESARLRLGRAGLRSHPALISHLGILDVELGPHRAGEREGGGEGAASTFFVCLYFCLSPLSPSGRGSSRGAGGGWWFMSRKLRQGRNSPSLLRPPPPFPFRSTVDWSRKAS